MIDIPNIIHNLLLGKQFYGVEIHTTESGVHYSVIEVLKEKTNLSITATSEFSDFDTLSKTLNPNIPLVVAFTGQNIITKKVTNDNGYRSKVLFNANEDDFYWYEYTAEEQIFISVSRKEIIDNTIVAFENSNFNIIDFSIGATVITTLKPLISGKTKIHSKTETLVFIEERLNEIIKSNNELSKYQIGEETISSGNITSFSSIVNYFYPNNNIQYEADFLKKNTEELKYKKATKYVGFGALGFFLVSLLLSFFALEYFQKQQQQVLTELNKQSFAYQKLIDLEKDKKNKEAILTESGIKNTHFISYYVNELISDIPNKIVIDKLDVFPVTKKIKQNQLIEFERDQIIIKGSVNNDEILNEWVQELKNIKWVQNIEINDYQKIKNLNVFTLKLSIQ